MSGGLSTLNFMQGAMEGYRFMEERKDRQLNRAQSLRMADIKEQEAGMLQQKWAAEQQKWKDDAAARETELDLKKEEGEHRKRRLGLDERRLKADMERAEPEHKAEMAAIEARRLANETLAAKNQMQHDQFLMKNQDDMAIRAADWVTARDEGKEYVITEEDRVREHLLGHVLPDEVMSPEGKKIGQSIKRLFNGEMDMKDPAVSEMIFFLNPDIKAAANHAGEFEDIQMIPSPKKTNDPKEPQKATFRVKFKGQDGYEPLTHGRSTDPNESVIEVDMADMSEKAIALVKMQNLMGSEHGRKVIKSYGIARKGQKTPSNPPKWELYQENGMYLMRDVNNGNRTVQLDPNKSLQALGEKARNNFLQRMSTDANFIRMNQMIVYAKDDTTRQAAIDVRDSYMDEMMKLQEMMSEGNNLGGGSGGAEETVAPPPNPAPLETSASSNTSGSSGGPPAPAPAPAPPPTVLDSIINGALEGKGVSLP